ncbi:MAG: VanZ family protein [Chromatiaceae bacterium]|nr:VanZ family protein [Chromatiaceae bacterium]
MKKKANSQKPTTQNTFLCSAIYLILSLLLTVSILYEATRSPIIWNETIQHLDKIVHFLVFSLLTFLIYKLVYFFGIKINWSHLLTVTIVVTGIGLVDELIQSLNPDRLPSFLDLLADFAGVLAVTLLMFRKIYSTKKNFSFTRIDNG